ncbi:MAG: hypothetical protein AAFY29_20805 [Pseudomonadota bacterium]
MVWFKRIMLFGGVVIVLELIAWVGIVTLGPDAFRQMLAFYDPRPDRAQVVEAPGKDGAVKRCAVFRDELLCIEEGSGSPGPDAVASVTPEPQESSRRCARFEGQEICIEEER